MAIQLFGKRLWWLVLIGLAARMAWSAAISVQPVSDSAAYLIFARNIVEHGVYGWTAEEPSAYWPVGTAGIYAGAYFIVKNWPLAIVLANLVAYVAGVWGLVTVTDRWFGRRTGTVAGALFALWPTHIMFVTVLASETLFLGVTLPAIALWTRAVSSSPRSLVWAVATGLLFGVGALIRPPVLLLPVVLVLSGFLRSREWRGLIVAGVAAAIAMMAVVAPWTVRNWNVLNSPVLISTNGAPNAWMGNNPGTTGYYEPLPDEVRGLTEVERAELLRRRTVEYVIAEPGAFVIRSARKWVLQHRTQTIGVGWNGPAIERVWGESALTPLKAAASLFFLAIGCAGVGGSLFVVFREGILRGLSHPAIVFIAYFSGVHAVTVIQDRYAMQWTPMLMALAAFAVTCVVFRREPNADSADDRPELARLSESTDISGV